MSERANTDKTELPEAWEFWITKLEHECYDIESIASFSTVEDFWDIFLQMPPASKIKQCNLSLFKKGIRPAWEDEKNRGGLAVRISSLNLTDDFWEHIVLAAIGGSLEKSIPVNAPFSGLSLIWKNDTRSLHFELWFGSMLEKSEVSTIAQLFSVPPSSIRVKRLK